MRKLLEFLTLVLGTFVVSLAFIFSMLALLYGYALTPVNWFAIAAYPVYIFCLLVPKRKGPKPERVDNVLFVPYTLSLRERFRALWDGIGTLFQFHIWIHEEDGSWRLGKYGADLKLGSFHAEIETFFLGYRYRMYDLSKDEGYQFLKFLEWVNTLDPDVRQAVMAEYKLAKEDGMLNEDR